MPECEAHESMGPAEFYAHIQDLIEQVKDAVLTNVQSDLRSDAQNVQDTISADGRE